jgi:FKBP-type peptidyl-prolyl cis-trans isomerase SlyD
MIQSGDFIKIHYTGKLSDGVVFDTTDAAVAARVGFEGKNFKPVIICVGQRMLVPGLDAALIGKPVGKFSVRLSAEHAFGKKDPRLVRIIPVAQLHKQNIRPTAGLRLNVDGNYGVVRSVSSGRTIVDFNHPLASQDVTYDIEVLAIVEEVGVQVGALLDAAGIPHKDIRVTGDNVTIVFPQMLPKPLLDALTDKFTTLTRCKTVSFEAGERPAAKPAAKPTHA